MTRRKGFTLIELLVVIAVIAVLMAILMPALSRVKKQAQSVACMSRLKSWGLIYKLYTDDYAGSFPLGWGKDESTQWLVCMRSYYNNEKEMLLCPTAKRLVLGASDTGTWKAWERTLDGANYIGSYGNNSWTDNMSADRGTGQKEWFWKTTQNIPNASNVPVLGDSTWHDAWPRDDDPPIPDPGRVSGWRSRHQWRDQPLLHRPSQRLDKSHVCRLVRAPRRAQGALDAQVAPHLQCQRPLDQGRRRQSGRLAAVAAEI